VLPRLRGLISSPQFDDSADQTLHLDVRYMEIVYVLNEHATAGRAVASGELIASWDQEPRADAHG
jgi:hypothetical protein